MRIVRGDGGVPYAGRFTGHVELQVLDAAPDASWPDTALGRFHAGAVTNWHSHPGGQNLWLVEGRGRIGNEVDGAVEIAPGTLVVTPPDERHWHGAMPGADAVWLTMTWGTTAWEDAAPADA